MINKRSSLSKYPFEYVYYFSGLAQEFINEPVLESFIDSDSEPTDLIAEFLSTQENTFEFLTVPFPVKSRLHFFCEHVFTKKIIDDIYPEADGLRSGALQELFLTTILNTYQIPHISFEMWFYGQEDPLKPNPCDGMRLGEAEDLLSEYYDFLSQQGTFQKICKILADEMFFILDLLHK